MRKIKKIEFPRRLYWEERKLASSLSNAKIAEDLGISETWVAKYITRLKKKKIIEVKRTGRASIQVLGEWLVDPQGKF